MIHWSPRILCILPILFLSLFATDSFGPGLSGWQQVKTFMLHMIPSFILIFFLVFAWKRELAGGAIFVILGLGFLPFIYMMNYQMNHSAGLSLLVNLVVNMPLIVAGVLFILSHFLKSKKSKTVS